MLRLPKDNEATPPLVNPGQAVEPREEAASTTVSSEPDEKGRVKKRRRSNRKKEEVFDETFAKKEEVNPKLVRGLMGSVALCGILLGGALLWPSGDEPGPVDPVGPIPAVITSTEPEKDDIQIEAERATVSPKLVEEEILPTIRKFLEAESPEEMARWVRHAELTLPRIEKFYVEGFRSVGFGKILWDRHPVRRGEAIRVVLEDGEYTMREIFVVDEDGWKVDWESLVGWSSLTWDELKESRSTSPVLFRVVVSDVSYYNFQFKDESRWSSYRLESLDGVNSLYAYVPRAGELDARLKSFEGIKSRQFIVKLRYPEDAPSDGQVLVDEIVAEGWLAPDDQS
ncbi:hypothetical protein [Haloferula sp.]|uniref:hypothetical protein n=1 Tax=Haloferula sp. TaxID=2497595 RepID=UPI0032A0EB17